MQFVLIHFILTQGMTCFKCLFALLYLHMLGAYIKMQLLKVRGWLECNANVLEGFIARIYSTRHLFKLVSLSPWHWSIGGGRDSIGRSSCSVFVEPKRSTASQIDWTSRAWLGWQFVVSLSENAMRLEERNLNHFKSQNQTNTLKKVKPYVHTYKCS